MAFLSSAELDEIGFKKVGRGALISNKASFYNPQQIEIGDHCRIDDFCVLSAGSGGIVLGRNIHIAVFCSLIGRGAIILEDFVNLSSRVAIYSSSDDFSGRSMTNPTIPEAFTNVTHAPVHLGRHVIIGCGSVILPGVTLEQGVAIGALSLVKKDCEAFSIYQGVPAVRTASRSRDLLDVERQFLDFETKV